MLAAVALSLVSRTVSAAGYKAVDLYGTSAPAGLTNVAGTVTSGAKLVGYGYAGGVNTHALFWNGTTLAVDLNPVNFAVTSSFLYGSSGAQQVGSATVTSAGGANHAILWNGTSTATDLNPTGLGILQSYASGTSGSQQVGYGSGADGLNHALLWNGNNSAVALTPVSVGTNGVANFNRSSASATNGSKQVGYGSGAGTGNQSHALLWSGTAATAIDLHPTNITGYTTSVATAISLDGKQEVGYGIGATPTRNSANALLWNGTSSVIELNPAYLGFTSSNATATNGTQQVGYGSGPGLGNSHALLWSGSSVAVDLQLLLPATYTESAAWSIDAAGNVFGTALDSSGITHVVEWAVPEPVGLSVLGLGSFGLMARRRRSPKRSPAHT